MVIILDATPTHPSTVQVAEYVVCTVGETVIETVESPVFHLSVPVQPDAVRVVFPPEQTVSEEAVIVGVCVKTVIKTGVEAGLTQLLRVQVAEYVVFTTGLTTIMFPVAPFDQLTVPEQL